MTPIEVRCPTCGAPPGARCRSGIQPGRRKGWGPGGRTVGYFHRAREAAADGCSIDPGIRLAVEVAQRPAEAAPEPSPVPEAPPVARRPSAPSPWPPPDPAGWTVPRNFPGGVAIRRESE